MLLTVDSFELAYREMCYVREFSKDKVIDLMISRVYNKGVFLQGIYFNSWQGVIFAVHFAFVVENLLVVFFKLSLHLTSLEFGFLRLKNHCKCLNEVYEYFFDCAKFTLLGFRDILAWATGRQLPMVPWINALEYMVVVIRGYCNVLSLVNICLQFSKVDTNAGECKIFSPFFGHFVNGIVILFYFL